MKTVTVCIGNSDNKLTQQEWSQFYDKVNSLVVCDCSEIYFVGCTNPSSQYQSATWVMKISDIGIGYLKAHLKYCRETFRQDSIAFIVGETEFV